MIEAPDATLDVVAAIPAIEDTRGAKAKGKRAGGPTEETREFWETWAESKTTREPEAKAEEPSREGRGAREERSGRSNREERGGRGGREERSGRSSREERAPKRAAAEATTEPAEATEAAAEPDAAEARSDRKSSRGRDRDRGRGKKDDDKRTAKKDDAPAKASSKSAASAAPAAAGDQARLFINLGKKHGVSADDLRTLLSGPVGGDTSRIGSVSLRDAHAHVRVPEDLADAIIEGVHGTTHNDESVTVERARA